MNGNPADQCEASSRASSHSEDRIDWDVQRVVDSADGPDGGFYRVSWGDTWEPARNLAHAHEEVWKFERARKRCRLS